ncbi:MAG: hypothetical protein KBC15_04305 [Candidatus Levybacteria bacterium]|nr:hypothetical protein [Candidatus Levybacteria bacterium]
MSNPIFVPLAEGLGLTSPDPADMDLRIEPDGTLKKIFERRLDELSPDQRDVIVRTFGLSNMPAMSDAAIADLFGKDSAWVEATRDEALKSLSELSHDRKITDI